MKLKIVVVFLWTSLSGFPYYAYAQELIGSIEKGMAIYQKRCAVCHNIDNDKRRIGPSLQNIINRKIGSHPNYNYSPAMKEAGNENLIWDKDKLMQFLKDPQTMIKGTRMATIPFSQNENLDDLIAYITTKSSNPEP